MKYIETLSSIEGRKALNSIFKEIRFDKQMSGIASLITSWRICTHEREIYRYSNQEITVLHPLGIFSGTGLWMEEIVNRFYFSAVNSFVYFGAALLLMLIGLRKFSTIVTDEIVIAGVAFEALMLIFIFVIMLFSPNDDGTGASEEENSSNELIMEIGEIGSEFAGISTQLERLIEQQDLLISTQVNTLQRLDKIVEKLTDAVSPNPAMIVQMSETNSILKDFKDTIIDLNESSKQLKVEAIQSAVKREFEKIITKSIVGNEKA